jgi:hypothetical protein
MLYECSEQDAATRRFETDTPIDVSKSQQTDTKRSVNFCRHVRVRTTLHLSNFTDDELESYWYSTLDFSQMKRDVLFAASLLQRNEDRLECNDAEAVCTRGVKSKTSWGAQRKAKRRVKLLNFVLDEQIYQAERGRQDEDMLARLCQACTKTSVLEAIFQGRLDSVGEESYIYRNNNKAKEMIYQGTYITKEKERNTKLWGSTPLPRKNETKQSPSNSLVPLLAGRIRIHYS